MYAIRSYYVLCDALAYACEQPTDMILDFAIVWAILIFLLYYIPYIGPIIAVTFPILTAALQFGELSPVLGLLAALVVVHMVVGYIIEPWLMGRNNFV